MLTLPPQAPTVAPPDTDLPDLPDSITIPDTADAAGQLCMIRLSPTFRDDGLRCGQWATSILFGMCGACWRPVGLYACQHCTDVTVELSRLDPAGPEFPLRTACCQPTGGPFLLMHVSPL
jgi:hypothetical protein